MEVHLLVFIFFLEELNFLVHRLKQLETDLLRAFIDLEGEILGLMGLYIVNLLDEGMIVIFIIADGVVVKVLKEFFQ